MGIAIFASCIDYEPDYVEVFSRSDNNFACWKAVWEAEWDTVEVLENSEARKILENIFMKWLDSELK